MKQSFQVRSIGRGDWALLRDIRLRSLADAPYAFESLLEVQRRLPDSWWRERTEELGERAAGLAAVQGGRWVGLVRVIREPDDPRIAELVSMWVDPAVRREGVARALVQRALVWAREHGVSRVNLWVTETNEAALRLYQACGFVRSGARQPVPTDPSRIEIAMHRRADRG